jgi:hypothetical protein
VTDTAKPTRQLKYWKLYGFCLRLNYVTFTETLFCYRTKDNQFIIRNKDNYIQIVSMQLVYISFSLFDNKSMFCIVSSFESFVKLRCTSCVVVVNFIISCEIIVKYLGLIF